MSPTAPGPASPETAGPPLYGLDPADIPNLDDLVTEDGAPKDSIFTEKQQRLLTEPLYNSWAAPVEGGAFLALANVGWFYKWREPPLVPDVLRHPDFLAGTVDTKFLEREPQLLKEPS